jgi:antitoxin component of MazEF toxin-antitoxin module
MRRKVVKVGASLCILLPKEVVKAMNWDFDDEIDLILDEAQELVILRNPPPPKPPQKKSLIDRFDVFQAEYEQVLNQLEPELQN